jgi:hypothetical protein
MNTYNDNLTQRHNEKAEINITTNHQEGDGKEINLMLVTNFNLNETSIKPFNNIYPLGYYALHAWKGVANDSRGAAGIY